MNGLKAHRTITVLPILMLFLIMAPSAIRTKAELTPLSTLPLPVQNCTIYGIHESGGNDAQLVSIDIRGGQQVSPFGPVQNGYDLEGLAINPGNFVMYAVSGEASNLPGQLYTVDGQTGELSLIGNTGFINVEALAFRPTDQSLWGWVKKAGLIEINAETGVGSLVFASNKEIEGLAWSNDGLTLYGVNGKILWAYDSNNSTLEQVANNFPRKSEALTIRPDGLLLGSNERHNAVHLFAYDTTTSQQVMSVAIPSSHDDIEAIAWPAACGNPSPGGEAELIQNVVVDKTLVCAGENIFVSVTAKHPESSNGTVDVSINGELGKERYLQFTGEPGIRLIHITAATPEKHIDSWEQEVEVVTCEEEQVFPLISARMNPFHNFTVDLDILNANVFSQQSPKYVWELGDGQIIETTTPFISHDYSDAIDSDQPYSVFQTRVTIQRSESADISAYKTVTIWNMYAVNKRRGIIQPRVNYEPQLTQSGDNYTGIFTVKNLEDEAIHFTSRQLEHQFCEPDQNTTSLTPESFVLDLAGQQEVTTEISIPTNTVSPDVCGIAVHLTGQTASQIDAYISLYFVVQNSPIMAGPITDTAMLELLNDIVERGLVDNPYFISDEDLYRLVRAGEISYPPVPAAAPLSDFISYESEIQLSPQDDIIGEPCLPDEEPPRPGVTCQATGEWEDHEDSVN